MTHPRLNGRPTPRIVVVGIGRWGMGDDAAGLHAARSLRRMFDDVPDEVLILDDESPWNVVAALADAKPRLLVLIDAAIADVHHPPGTFAMFGWPGEATVRLRSEEFGLSIHTVGVRGAAELITTLTPTPPEIMICAVFGESFERSFELDRRVEAALTSVSDVVESLIRRRLRGAIHCTN